MANATQIAQHLQAFDFEKLFNALGWQNPTDRSNRKIDVDGDVFDRKQVSQLSGIVVFEITSPDGSIPDSKTRRKVHSAVSKIVHENVLIFVDRARTQSVWLWVKNEKGKAERREHDYFRGQPVDLMLSKLVRINFELTDYDEDGNPPPIIEVARRLKESLDIEKVTKKFYGEFQTEHLKFLEYIKGISDERDRRWYASVILNRLMFIYFLQKKFFIDNNENYLADKLVESKANGKDLYFEEFLKPLFFTGFAKPDSDPEKRELKEVLGEVPFLNGGLFLPHKIEIDDRYDIKIKDTAFDNILNLFGRYSWNLDDTPGGKANEINPDVLGYIFEKYINQKAFGAYYTRPEITQYLCERTIYKLILDRVEEIKRFDSMAELLLNLDAKLCTKLWFDVLPSLSILDPACGSGAFLVAALKTLLNVYSAVIGKMETLGDKQLKDELEKIRKEHSSVNYDIKKRIITNNLYGVDIMEEATEIAKLRLFMTLVSSVHKKSDLEPLPNIDFNILAGNSLIGILKVDERGFDSIGHLEQISLGFDDSAQTYRQILEDKNKSIEQYRNHALKRGDDESGTQDDRLLFLREHIEKVRAESYQKLNELLLGTFNDLKIKFEQATWDEAKKKEGKPLKRELVIDDIQALHPFHWGYEFDQIMSTGGFDVIITNPPWETFKPESKEFFAEYSDTVLKNKTTIKDFEKQKEKLLLDPAVRAKWLAYRSRFPHANLYFRTATQYLNQTSYVDDEKVKSDLNLFKLFLEQSLNLLRRGGECGIVIPSSIYTDLGAKQLRKMLFSETEITGLFGFENRRIIFEGVDSRFKFVIFTFSKGGTTSSFPAAFMRHDVNELETFPNDESIRINVSLIEKLSPNALSLMEFRDGKDVSIVDKMTQFPLLLERDRDKWNLELKREFHMTDDSYLFHSEASESRLPLYEGKMIFHYAHQLASPRYFIEESEGRRAILKGEDDNNISLDYEEPRFALRRIASNTNERSLICTMIPSRCFASESFHLIAKNQLNNREQLFLTGLMNSFALDYYMRQKISQNLSMFHVYTLPVPRLTAGESWFDTIVNRAAKLICTTPEFDDLAKEIGLGSHRNGVTDETERQKLRAELDAIVAHLYCLTEEEFAYILTTFPLVSDDIKAATLNKFRTYEEWYGH